MDRKTAKNIIINSLPNYLAQKGIRIDKNFLCLNPEHCDHTPSMTYDRRRNRCHCFACGADADTLNLIQWDYGVDFAEAFHIGCDLFGLDIGQEEQKKPVKIKPAKQTQMEKTEIKKAEPEVCDKVYRTMKILMPLTEEDMVYLREKRCLTEDRIQKDYMRMVTEEKDRKIIVEKIQKLTGFSVDVLKYVPGFFVNKETGKLDFSGDGVPSVSHGTTVCNNRGIGILIHNVDGYAVGIQIRRDTANKGNRYCWFTSIFAVDNPKYDGGSSPGAEKDIIIPKNPKNCICITEGRFKSEILAKERNTVISLQGVSSWRGIDEIISQLQEKLNVRSIYLMFDSDMMGNRQVFQSVSSMAKMLMQAFPDITIKTGVWQIKYGKGIDDCIIAGNMKQVKFLDINQFMDICENAFQTMLKIYKIESLKKMGNEDRKVFNKKLQAEIERRIFIKPDENTEAA